MATRCEEVKWIGNSKLVFSNQSNFDEDNKCSGNDDEGKEKRTAIVVAANRNKEMEKRG